MIFWKPDFTVSTKGKAFPTRSVGLAGALLVSKFSVKTGSANFEVHGISFLKLLRTLFWALDRFAPTLRVLN